MSPDPKPWITELYFVLRNHQGSILLRDGGLPYLRLESRFWSPQVAAFTQPLGELLGKVAVLRCVYHHSDKEAQHVQVMYELEALETPSGVWSTDLPTSSLPANVAEALHNDLQAPASALRSAWAKPGWFARASDWIKSELTRLGYEISRVQTIKTWGISCVIKVNTSREDVYFKVSKTPRAISSDSPMLLSPLWSHEPLLTQALSERFPDLVPRPLAVELQERWMLLADFGKELREQKANLETWRDLLGRYAKMQQATAEATDWLLEIGCLDRRMEVLKFQFSALLRDETAMHTIGEEADKLRAVEPMLLQSCDALAELGIPYALTHVDFHAGNIASQGSRYTVFDWTDACVTHPFFDIPYLLADLERELGEEAKQPLLDAYLSPWADRVSVDQLQDQLPLVELVSQLHQAVTYWKIVESLEPAAKFELASTVPHYLRQILDLYQRSPNAERRTPNAKSETELF